jgi:hypothetical protein
MSGQGTAVHSPKSTVRATLILGSAAMFTAV